MGIEVVGNEYEEYRHRMKGGKKTEYWRKNKKHIIGFAKHIDEKHERKQKNKR